MNAINTAVQDYCSSEQTPSDLEALQAVVTGYGLEMDGENLVLLNVAPGLSASFNSWFALFGQFFHHGLDPRR